MTFVDGIIQGNNMDLANRMFIYCGKRHNEPLQPDISSSGPQVRHCNDGECRGNYPFKIVGLLASAFDHKVAGRESIGVSLCWPSGHGEGKPVMGYALARKSEETYLETDQISKW